MIHDPQPGDREPPEAADAEETEPIAFEPTGLDLARSIAAAAGRSAPATGPRRTPPKKTAGRPKASTRGDKADPMALGDALEGVIKERGWSTEINVHLLLGRWSELVGEAVAEHSTPEAFRSGVLVVRTSSTNWASQLRLMAPQLLARMNDHLGQGSITRVQILGPQAPSWRHGPRTVQGRGPRDTYG